MSAEQLIPSVGGSSWEDIGENIEKKLSKLKKRPGKNKQKKDLQNLAPVDAGDVVASEPNLPLPDSAGVNSEPKLATPDAVVPESVISEPVLIESVTVETAKPKTFAESFGEGLKLDDTSIVQINVPKQMKLGDMEDREGHVIGADPGRAGVDEQMRHVKKTKLQKAALVSQGAIAKLKKEDPSSTDWGSVQKDFDEETEQLKTRDKLVERFRDVKSVEDFGIVGEKAPELLAIMNKETSGEIVKGIEVKKENATEESLISANIGEIGTDWKKVQNSFDQESESIREQKPTLNVQGEAKKESENEKIVRSVQENFDQETRKIQSERSLIEEEKSLDELRKEVEKLRKKWYVDRKLFDDCQLRERGMIEKLRRFFTFWKGAPFLESQDIRILKERKEESHLKYQNAKNELEKREKVLGGEETKKKQYVNTGVQRAIPELLDTESDTEGTVSPVSIENSLPIPKEKFLESTDKKRGSVAEDQGNRVFRDVFESLDKIPEKIPNSEEEMTLKTMIEDIKRKLKNLRETQEKFVISTSKELSVEIIDQVRKDISSILFGSKEGENTSNDSNELFQNALKPKSKESKYGFLALQMIFDKAGGKLPWEILKLNSEDAVFVIAHRFLTGKIPKKFDKILDQLKFQEVVKNSGIPKEKEIKS